MMHGLFRILLAPAAAWLLAATACFAAAPSVPDEQLEPLTSAYLRVVKPGDEAELHRELFGTVLRRVSRSYAREVDMPALLAAAMKTLEPLAPHSGEPGEVFKKAINAGLATLDPHSRYLDPMAASLQRGSITGRFGGLGLQVDMADGLVRVVTAMPGTPAARAGLQSGDLIVRFDDQPVQGMTLTQAVFRMRGEPGTPIELLIRRGGEQEDEFRVSLVRELIGRETVRWSREGDVLVLRLASFTGLTWPAMGKAISEAAAAGHPRAIVLDLRGNTGGLFRQALITADAFLGKGEIVSLQGRAASSRRTWRADANEQLTGAPMVVLIDGRSASASELVAAALQENGRAVVMGQRSFGKGSVQSMISLGDDKGMLRLTTGLYYGPSGRSVQRTGVNPDIELVPAQVPAARSRRREADRANGLPGTDEPLPPKARVEETRCAPSRKDLDLGLACALAFIQAGGIDEFVVAVETGEPDEREP